MPRNFQLPRTFRHFTIGLFSLTTLLLPLLAQATENRDRPNIVVILTDNHGAWTLGCYGNPDIKTPNIDRLARTGTLFTRAFASNPVCSPTRATLLTGLIPSQHGVHCFLVGNRLQVGPEARCTLDTFQSLPEILKQAGYQCGLVGKWHLGDNLNPQEGFEDYWITMPHGGTSTFYDAPIIEDGAIRNEPQYLTDFWTRHAVKFIEESAAKEDPFFLFLSYNGPYSLGRLLLREGRNRHAEYYSDKELASFPREKTHPWQFSNRDYINNPVSIRRVATEVSGVDDGVGTIMRTLEENGIDDNTLVVFLADQGWVGGHEGYFGMGDHTRPLTARDGMMRIPMIWHRPGTVAEGRKSDLLVSNYDVLPSLLKHLGLSDKMSAKPASPGVDFSDELVNPTHKSPLAQSMETPIALDKSQERGGAVFYEFENLRCIRTELWKYVHRHPNGPHELYDLRNDPNEIENLVASAFHSQTRGLLKRQLEEFYSKYAEPRFDMWNGGGSQTRIFAGIDEETLQREKVDPPELTKGFVKAELKVPDGFEVELVAGPPLVTHPTLACFDDRGRLFVCNNAGVNMSAADLEKNLPNGIRMLEDRDGDGHFDHSTMFADKMTFPMGGAWHDGALYVASPPNIWRLEDTTGDGIADKRDAIVSHFGYTGNAASIHGCFLGPDGRIYWCDGYHGHEFTDENGKTVSKREGSYIVSCKTDGSDVRLYCGGGMDNPVEVDFTDEGDLLGTVNILYTRPRIDCFVNWQYGGTYPHREKVLNELKVTGDWLKQIHDFGHVAISGTTRYRSGAIDHRWRDNYFATFFNSGKIVRLELEQHGSTYQVQQRELLSATSRDFHPTDVLEDADGSLLVVDTGGWFYRGCPTSQVAKPDIMGGIYRIRRKGMTTLEDPWGARIVWKDIPNNSLMKFLNDSRFKVRERAVSECVTRVDSIVPLLRRYVKRGDIRVRRNAVWALTQIAGLPDRQLPVSTIARSKRISTLREEAQEGIMTALTDAVPGIQRAALRSLATYPTPSATPQLLSMLSSSDAAVRRDAAMALGQIKNSSVISALVNALGKEIDRDEEHSLIYAIMEINDPSATQSALKRVFQSRGRDIYRMRQVKGLLVALDQMDSGSLSGDIVAPLLDSSDVEIRRAAVQLFMRHTDWANQIPAIVDRWFDKDYSLGGKAETAQSLLSSFLANQEVAVLVGKYLVQSTPPETRQLVLRSIAQGQSVSLHKSWIAPLARALKDSKGSELEQVIVAVASIKSDHFADQLKTIARDVSRPVLVRVSALEAVSSQRGRLSEEVFTLLISLVAENGLPRETDRAIQMIGNAALTPEQMTVVTQHLGPVSSMQLRDLIKPFSRVKDQKVATTFLTAVEGSRAFLTLQESELSDVAKRFPADILPQVNRVLDKLKQHHQKKLGRLESLIPLLSKGNAEQGKKLFFSEKAKCSACHRVGSDGKQVGPDLSTIGSNRTDRDLVESIVFPSASIVRDYGTYVIATKNGRTLTGVIARETVDAVSIQQQTGDTVVVPISEIDAIEPNPLSIMPQGLDEALTESQLADVVAYLQGLQK